MNKKLAEEMRQYAAEIRAFDRQCRLDEETDTEEGWRLLTDVRLFLMRAARGG